MEAFDSECRLKHVELIDYDHFPDEWRLFKSRSLYILIAKTCGLGSKGKRDQKFHIGTSNTLELQPLTPNCWLIQASSQSKTASSSITQKELVVEAAAQREGPEDHNN